MEKQSEVITNMPIKPLVVTDSKTTKRVTFIEGFISEGEARYSESESESDAGCVSDCTLTHSPHRLNSKGRILFFIL